MHDIDTIKDQIDRLGEEVGAPDLAAFRRQGDALRRRRRIAITFAAAAAVAAVGIPAGLALTGPGQASRSDVADGGNTTATTTTPELPRPTTSGPEVGTFLESVVRSHLGENTAMKDSRPLDRYMAWPAKANDPVQWPSAYQWTLETGGGLDVDVTTGWNIYPITNEKSPGFNCQEYDGVDPDQTCFLRAVPGGSVTVHDVHLQEWEGSRLQESKWATRTVTYSDADYSFFVSVTEGVRASSLAEGLTKFTYNPDELIALATDPDLRLPDVAVLPPNEQNTGDGGCDGPCGGS